jgi:glycosyltransferase involved in cell wall biosynthesis
MAIHSSKIAIITRTKNRPLLLPRAAESVLSQENGNLMWVVVNDGGNRDGVENIAQDFSRRSDNEVIVIHNETSVGMEAASNIGISSSDSEYIIIHDDDDSWEPGFLSNCLQFLQDKNGYKGVISLTTTVKEQVEGATVKKLDSQPFNSHLNSVDLSHIAIRNQFPPISFLFSRDIYNEVGGFNENMPVLGDWDFNLRFLMKADIGLVPEYLANHHIRVTDSESAIEYGNTVVSGLSRHLEYESQYRHARYRDDLARKEVGLGHLLMSGKQFQLLDEKMEQMRIAGDGWRKIQKAARKFGIN